MWAAVAIALALAAYGRWGACVLPWRPQALRGAQQEDLPAALVRAREVWRARGKSGKASERELVALGQEKLAQDSAPSDLEALELFEQALLVNPTSEAAATGAVQALAWGLRPLGDDDVSVARAVLQVARRATPSSLSLDLAQGDLELRLGTPEGTRRALALAEGALRAPQGDRLAEAHLLKARALSDAPALALHELDLALAANEGLKRAYVPRAQAKALLLDFKGAREDLFRLLSIAPDSAEAQLALGVLESSVGQFARAAELLGKGQRRHPEDARFGVALAQAKAGSEGKVPEAEWRSFMEAREAYQRGDYDKAREGFQAELAVHPERADVGLWLALAEAKTGRTKDAQESLRRAATLDLALPSETLAGAVEAAWTLPHTTEDPTPDLLDGALRLARHEDAGSQKALKRRLSVDERNALGQGLLALVLLDQHKTKEARTAAERAAKAEHTDVLAHWVLAQLALEAHNAEQGRRELLEAERLAPGLVSVELKLAQLEAGRDPASAQARLKKLLTVAPNHLAARRALDALEEGAKTP
jgi:predicted Zn-dependent protease